MWRPALAGPRSPPEGGHHVPIRLKADTTYLVSMQYLTDPSGRRH